MLKYLFNVNTLVLLVDWQHLRRSRSVRNMGLLRWVQSYCHWGPFRGCSSSPYRMQSAPKRRSLISVVKRSNWSGPLVFSLRWTPVMLVEQNCQRMSRHSLGQLLDLVEFWKCPCNSNFIVYCNQHVWSQNCSMYCNQHVWSQNCSMYCNRHVWSQNCSMYTILSGLEIVMLFESASDYHLLHKHISNRVNICSPRFHLTWTIFKLMALY